MFKYFLLLALYFTIFQCVKGQQSQLNLLTVTGQATGSYPPNLLVINFNIRSQHINPQIAIEKNSAVVKLVSQHMSGLSLSQQEISTSNFNLHPVYDSRFENNNYIQIFKGYEVSNRISIRTSRLELAGKIIDGAVKNGVDQVESVDFALLPESKRQLEDSLIQKAVENARNKANISLSALNFEVKGVNSIALDGNSLVAPPRPSRDNGMMSKSFAAMSDAMPEGGTQMFSSNKDVSVSATVSFIIGPK